MFEDNEFKFAIPITRSYKKDDGSLYIEGVASSTDLDNHGTIFNKNCQEGFALDINSASGTDEPITVEVEHKGEEEPMNNLGAIEKAYVTEANQLFIVARLDDKNPKAIYYWELLSNPDPKLGRPKRLGFSIRGVVKEAHWEFKDSLSKNVRVFDRVKLKKVGIVREPSNPQTWVEKIARSVNWSDLDKENSMAEEIVVSVDETVVTDVTLVERAEEVQSEAVAEEIVQDATVERTDKAVEEVAEVVDAAVDAVEVTEELRSEEAIEAPEEVAEVARTDKWGSRDLLEVLSSITDAASKLESFVNEQEWYKAEGESDKLETRAARAALSMIHSAVPLLLGAFALKVAPREETMEERALDTSNTEAIQKEDLSDEDTKRSEKVSEEVAEVKEEIIVRAETHETKVEGTLSINGVEIADLIATAVTTAIGEVERKMSDVVSKLEAKETENTELVERVKKLESAPATIPGGQVITSYESLQRNRKMSDMDKYQEAIERAKSSGNSQELIKLQILGKMYNLE